MLRVALTGGMGSGKSTVARLLSARRIPVLRADDVSKSISVTDPKVRRRIRTLAGPAAYRRDGSLDRTFVASKVFRDPDLLRRLERLLHPKVRTSLRRWFRDCSSRLESVAVVEAALVFEAGLEKEVDIVIVVEAPLRTRIDRIRKRDLMSVADIKRRMRTQMGSAEKRARAHIVIRNDGTLQGLERRTAFVAGLLKRIAQSGRDTR